MVDNWTKPLSETTSISTEVNEVKNHNWFNGSARKILRMIDYLLEFKFACSFIKTRTG